MNTVSYFECACVVSIETGLQGVLFGMLDKETDQRLLSDIHDTLISMLHELSGKDLARWLTLCKTVLSASKGESLEITIFSSSETTNSRSSGHQAFYFVSNFIFA